MDPDFDPRDLEPTMPRDEPKRRSRLLPLALIGVGTAAVAGVGGWFALDMLSSAPEQTTAQHIRADPSAVRIRPDQPGGLQVPHQDKQVLESPAQRSAAGGVERLLPAPEQPVQRPVFGGPVPTAPGFAPPPNQSAAVNPSALPPAIAPTPPRPAPQAIFPPQAPVQPPAPAATTAPPARPIPITPPVAAVPAPPVPQAAPRPGVPDVAPLPPQQGRGPVALAPQAPPPPAAAAAAPQPLQPPPAARPAAPAPQVAAVPSGGRRIQLAAVGSREGANSEWAKMQRAHPELAGLQLTVQQVEINGRPVFRIQAGPLDDDGVRRTCAAVSARGQACIAVR